MQTNVIINPLHSNTCLYCGAETTSSIDISNIKMDTDFFWGDIIFDSPECLLSHLSDNCENTDENIDAINYLAGYKVIRICNYTKLKKYKGNISRESAFKSARCHLTDKEHIKAKEGDLKVRDKFIEKNKKIDDMTEKEVTQLRNTYNTTPTESTTFELQQYLALVDMISNITIDESETQPINDKETTRNNLKRKKTTT